MKLGDLQRVVFDRRILSIAAGLIWTLAFPKPGIAGFAWLAPALVLFSAIGCEARTAFRLGYLSGIVHYLSSLYWLLFIPFPAGAIAGWLALSAYLALYPAVWVWVCWRSFPVKNSRTISPETQSDENNLRSQITTISSGSTFVQRACWSLVCAVIWVALEMLRARFLTGFAWNFLGVSQYKVLPIIQIASVTGVYGVSFLMVWFSVSLAFAGTAVVARPGVARLFVSDLSVPLLAVATVAAFGVKRMSDPRDAERTLKIALIQPSIPQTLIWDAKENTNRFRKLIELSERALAAKPDLLVWPEAAVPDLLRYEPETFGAVRKLVSEHHVWMILGADDAVPQSEKEGAQKFDFYNSSFLMNPSGEIVGTYRKRRLVIFGEYVPLVRWLPFLKYLTPVGDGFKAGEEVVPFSLPELSVHTSVLICFEDSFPQFACEHVKPDTDFLLNLSNNGWFGESAAQWQHAANAVFRAVENGVPLVRATNNGLTCWVDVLGGLHDVYFPNSTNIYEAGFKIVRVPIPSSEKKREETFYNLHGDWFGWGCVGLTAGLMGFNMSASRKRRA